MESQITNKDLRCLDIAYNAAHHCTLQKFQLGACLRLKKKDICWGFANTRSKVGKYSISSVHAEMDVLLKSNIRLKNPKHATVYVVRISLDGSLRNAKPCSHCVVLMKRCNIRFCCWSTGDETAPFTKAMVRMLDKDHLSRCQRRFLNKERHKGKFPDFL